MANFIVRYGTLRLLGVMEAQNKDSYSRGSEVVVRSDRGVELGQVLCEATDDALSHLDQPPIGQILRKVSPDDVSAIEAIDSSRGYKMKACQKHINELGLDMQLVDLEELLGKERVIVFYLSEKRVDFRQLLKRLAAEFKTRIEMKQIGVRDEAKLLADYGDCGKPVCCNNHLVKMPPVSMKMAKLQKATLDPTKISGRCGRLKCCLRYEFETYEAIQKALPRVGAQVLTRDGKAQVISQRLITEQLLVETEDHRRIVIEASEVLSVLKRSGETRKTKPKTKQPIPLDQENE
ncbi:MAG: regulatory iron-sulfur-containing complex subunit RicT [Planctomycetota bacterium]